MGTSSPGDDERPLRVLVVHRGIAHARDEGREVLELTAGLVHAADRRGGMQVMLSDLRNLYRLDLHDPGCPGGYELTRIGAHRELRFGPVPDVAHIHLVVRWTHLLTALLLRLRGVRVVFSPMSMLGRDFAGSSWFRSDGRLATRAKPLAITALRWAWKLVADVFVVASEEEREQGRLPAARCAMAPLVTPDSPLSHAILERPPLGDTADDQRPIAFLTRFDPHRKGIDRLVSWVQAHRDELPTPAVLLLAPGDGRVPPDLQELIDEGLVAWDSTSRGPAVLEAFATCRGAMLLSRWDGQPRVLREAAVFGLPTLSTVSSHFAEVVDTLGVGTIVDGDDPADVQRGYRELADQVRRGDEARRLFDRNRVGEHLYDVMVAARARTLPTEPSYYARLAEVR